ncbi:MAG: DUF262 domain-containing protein [Arcicella sp.]|jgi:uncharacterized protein with ParB-like and HNH nuclease domain|nr:DUF262 domain-containing protein [Arcicella sp.]
MSENIKIKPDKRNLLEYIEDFQLGKIQVPAFQRDFVWDNNKKLELFDSIQKGYPIGSILLWRPDFKSDEDFYKFESKEIGFYKIPERATNDYFYILDGYQRLSLLFGCLVNPEKTKLQRDDINWFKEFNIVYNLQGDGAFEMNKKKDFSHLEYYQIPIYKLIDAKEFFSFQKQLSLFDFDESVNNDLLEKYENISQIFQKYELPSINIFGGSITEAIDIFQRLNTAGVKMSSDWAISALSFNKDENFRLASEIDNLLEDLEIYNFKNQKREVILQCITNSFGGVYFDQFSKNDNKKIEVLARRSDFIEITRKTVKSIIIAVKFLYEDLLVLDSKLLPYNSQLIFITDFFNKIENPTDSQLRILKEWFWITTYSNYFTIYNLTKQRLAYNKFQDFIEGKSDSPIYYDSLGEKFDTLEFPDKVTMGSVRAKALASFMLNYSLRESNILDGLSINAENIEGYRTFKLFSDIENSNVSENTILVVEKFNSLDNIPRQTKNLSHWLNLEYKGQFQEYFINDEMRKEYKKGNIEKVLQIRKGLIIESEKFFVEGIGLVYNTQ